MLSELNFFVSFIAGVISFLSPCVFPLVPSFLFSLSGSVGGAQSSGEASEEASGEAVDEIRKRVLLVRTLFFILGFTILFVTLGYIFSSAGILLGRLSVIVNVVAGSLVILLGLHQLFNIFRFLQFEMRFHRRGRGGGNISSLLAGFAFGAGWSPCIGPLLTAILVLASQSGSAALGIAYLSLYGLGLGLPFVLIVTCIPLARCRAFLNRHLQRIKRVGGVMLIAVGLLIIFGQWRILNSTLVRWGRGLERVAMSSPSIALGCALTLYGLLLGLCAHRLLRRALQHRRTQTHGQSAEMNAEVRSPSQRRSTGSSVLIGSIALLCVLLIVLEASGRLETIALIGRWLQFQGV